jgi:hypothetical protein
MVFCSGCRRNFKPSGYTLHIRRSPISTCAAAHREALQVAEQNHNPSDNVEEASQFQGDFYGDYEETDFQWPAEADLDDESEDDDIHDNEEYIDIDADAGACQGEPMADHQGADLFIENFPSSSTGAAISDGHVFIETDYNCYRRQFGNVNAYEPFVSQIDWDVAHWAKVHGITSTAVTQLLGIKGVGFYTAHYI